MQGLIPIFICMHSLLQPHMRGWWRQFQLLGGRLVWSRALSGLLPASPRSSPRARSPGNTHGSGSPPCPALYRTSDTQLIALYRTSDRQLIGGTPHCLVHSSCLTLVASEGTRRMGVGRGTFLRSSSISSLSRLGEHFRLTNAPQMLSSLLEMSNSVEDQTVWIVAPTSKTDDMILPAEVLPGRTSGVSFVRGSCQSLLSSFLRVSIRLDGMAGNSYVRSGHVLS